MPTKITAVQKGTVTVRKTGCDQPAKREREQCSTAAVRELARKIALEHRKVFEELAK